VSARAVVERHSIAEQRRAAIARARTIDLHAHAVLAETMGAAGEHGPELGTDAAGRPWFRVGGYRLEGVRYVGSPFMDVSLRLAEMDRRGIDFQVLSPNPLTYFHFIPPADAVRFCARHNETLAALVDAYPERLAGLAALPIQDPSAAVAELRRAVRTLGLIGAQIGTDLPLALDDATLDPVYAEFVALDVPLFIHPAPAGIDGPPGDPRLKRFDLDLLTGFAAQETLALGTLVYGGVLERHPRLEVWLSHGGGGLAMLAGRMRRATAKRPWVRDGLRAPGAFEAALRRVWYDAHVHDDAALAHLARLVGEDRLVFGTNFAGWDQPEADEVAAVPCAYADNARRLLRVATGQP
jgi:aminocarboxymuconate-semialdehyde decarboxylase